MTNEDGNGRRPLPEGWVWTTIGAVTQPIVKVRPEDKPSDEFTYLDISGIDNGRNVVAEVKKYVGSDAPSRARQQVEAGDVLFSTVRTYLKNIAVVPEAYDGQVASTGFSVLRAESGVVGKYLFYYTLTDDFLGALGKLQRGTSYPAVRDSDVREQPIPLAPTLEQQSIVSEIEKQLTRLDAAVAALRRAKAGLARYKAAVLKAAVEGRLVAQDPDDEPASELLERILAERRRGWEAAHPGKQYVEPKRPEVEGLPGLPEGWVWATVEQIGDSREQPVLTGPFGSTLGRDDFVASGIPLLTIGCLTERGVTLDKAFYVSEQKAGELTRYRVREGDLLFSRMAAVGRAGIVPKGLEGSIINYHLMRLRLSSSAIIADYFMYYVRGARAVENYIREVNHGVTRDGINTSQLLEMPVALPPRFEQQRIVDEIERLISVAQASENVIAANLTRAERLRQAVLGKAFRGEL